MTQQADVNLPDDVPFDPNVSIEDLPELPDGYVWGLKITASAEVVHPDGTKD